MHRRATGSLAVGREGPARLRGGQTSCSARAFTVGLNPEPSIPGMRLGSRVGIDSRLEPFAHSPTGFAKVRSRRTLRWHAAPRTTTCCCGAVISAHAISLTSSLPRRASVSAQSRAVSRSMAGDARRFVVDRAGTIDGGIIRHRKTTSTRSQREWLRVGGRSSTRTSSHGPTGRSRTMRSRDTRATRHRTLYYLFYRSPAPFGTRTIEHVYVVAARSGRRSGVAPARHGTRA